MEISPKSKATVKNGHLPEKDPDSSSIPKTSAEMMMSQEEDNDSDSCNEESLLDLSTKKEPKELENSKELEDPPADDETEDGEQVTPKDFENKGSGQEYQFQLKTFHIIKGRQGKKLYKCDVCAGVYRHAFSLKRHFLRNHVNYKYLSEADITNCNINLSLVSKHSKFSAERSGKSVQNKKGKDCKFPGLYRCHICSQFFDFKNELKTHVNDHPDTPFQKRFTCTHCDMTFSHKQNLVRHLTVHASEKLFSCKYCGKCFTSLMKQKKHEHIHENRQTFTCSICSEEFAQAMDFRKHVRKQHAGQYYPCAFCEQVFQKAEQLEQHVLSHGQTLESNYLSLRKKCKSSTIEDVHSVLFKTKVGNRPEFKYTCSVCKKRFISYLNMCRHKKAMHAHASEKRTRPLRPREEVAKLRSQTAKIVKKELTEEEFYMTLHDRIVENLLYYVDGKSSQLNIKHDHYTFSEERIEDEAVDWDICCDLPSSEDFSERFRLCTDHASAALLPVENLIKCHEIDLKEKDTKEPEELNGFCSNAEDHRILHVSECLDLSPVKNTCEPIPQVIGRDIPIIYICSVCREKFYSLDAIEDHKINNHPNVLCTHVELEGEKDPPPELCWTFTSPVGILNQEESAADSSSDANLKCTKCEKTFNSSESLHEHILECGTNSSFRKQLKKGYSLYSRRGRSARKLRTAIKNNELKFRSKSNSQQHFKSRKPQRDSLESRSHFRFNSFHHNVSNDCYSVNGAIVGITAAGSILVTPQSRVIATYEDIEDVDDVKEENDTPDRQSEENEEGEEPTCVNHSPVQENMITVPAEANKLSPSNTNEAQPNDFASKETVSSSVLSFDSSPKMDNEKPLGSPGENWETRSSPVQCSIATLSPVYQHVSDNINLSPRSLDDVIPESPPCLEEVTEIDIKGPSIDPVSKVVDSEYDFQECEDILDISKCAPDFSASYDMKPKTPVVDDIEDNGALCSNNDNSNIETISLRDSGEEDSKETLFPTSVHPLDSFKLITCDQRVPPVGEMLKTEDSESCKELQADGQERNLRSTGAPSAKSHTCNTCNRSFTYLASLKKHIQDICSGDAAINKIQKHKIKNKGLKGDVDSSVDTTAEMVEIKEESALESHETEPKSRVGRKYQEHTCPHCLRSFAYLANYRKHVREGCIIKKQVEETLMEKSGLDDESDDIYRLTQKGKIEHSVIGIMRNQSKQIKLIGAPPEKENSSPSPASSSQPPNFMTFSCNVCHKIFLSYVKMLQHRLSHKLQTDDSDASPFTLAFLKSRKGGSKSSDSSPSEPKDIIREFMEMSEKDDDSITEVMLSKHSNTSLVKHSLRLDSRLAEKYILCPDGELKPKSELSVADSSEKSADASVPTEGSKSKLQFTPVTNPMELEELQKEFEVVLVQNSEPEGKPIATDKPPTLSRPEKISDAVKSPDQNVKVIEKCPDITKDSLKDTVNSTSDVAKTKSNEVKSDSVNKLGIEESVASSGNNAAKVDLTKSSSKETLESSIGAGNSIDSAIDSVVARINTEKASADELFDLIAPPPKKPKLEGDTKKGVKEKVLSISEGVKKRGPKALKEKVSIQPSEKPEQEEDTPAKKKKEELTKKVKTGRSPGRPRKNVNKDGGEKSKVAKQPTDVVGKRAGRSAEKAKTLGKDSPNLQNEKPKVGKNAANSPVEKSPSLSSVTSSPSARSNEKAKVKKETRDSSPDVRSTAKTKKAATTLQKVAIKRSLNQVKSTPAAARRKTASPKAKPPPAKRKLLTRQKSAACDSPKKRSSL